MPVDFVRDGTRFVGEFVTDICNIFYFIIYYNIIISPIVVCEIWVKAIPIGYFNFLNLLIEIIISRNKNILHSINKL